MCVDCFHQVLRQPELQWQTGCNRQLGRARRTRSDDDSDRLNYIIFGEGFTPLLNIILYQKSRPHNMSIFLFYVCLPPSMSACLLLHSG